MSINYGISNTKELLEIAYPKNINTVSTESYCLNSDGDLLYCYYSGDLGILVKNSTTNVTERFLIVSKVDYLDIDYNTTNNSYILFYKSKSKYYLKYLKDSEYIVKELTILKTTDKVFMTYDKISDRITLIFKDDTSNLISEINSLSDFQSVVILKEDPIPKESLISVEYNQISNLINVDLIVNDNSLLKDIESHPNIKDKTFRYIPIDVNNFEVVT